MRGRQQVQRVFEELQESSPKPLRQPTNQGESWYSLVAEGPVPPTDALLAAVAQAEAAAVVSAAALGDWRLALVSDGDLDQTHGDRERLGGLLGTWVARWNPQVRPPQRVGRRDWHLHDPLDDAPVALLRDAGWAVHAGFADVDLWRPVAAVEHSFMNVWDRPVAWTASRWVPGLLDNSEIGMFDRDEPKAPPVLVSRNDRAAQAGWFAEEIITPLSERVELTGRRAWTRLHRRNPDPDTAPTDLVALLHHHPSGRVSITSLWGPLWWGARTYRSGSINLLAYQVEAGGRPAAAAPDPRAGRPHHRLGRGALGRHHPVGVRPPRRGLARAPRRRPTRALRDRVVRLRGVRARPRGGSRPAQVDAVRTHRRPGKSRAFVLPGWS